MVATPHEYELVVILRPDLTDDNLAAATERVQQAVKARGGEIADLNNWGRRRLAYPIKRNLEGSYLVMQMRLDPTQVSDLESSFRISEDVIRHLVVRKED